MWVLTIKIGMCLGAWCSVESYEFRSESECAAALIKRRENIIEADYLVLFSCDPKGSGQ
ncbi:MAG: hypothetical protein AAFN94_00685 [Pseudomonadota bacterium]